MPDKPGTHLHPMESDKLSEIVSTVLYTLIQVVAKAA